WRSEERIVSAAWRPRAKVWPLPAVNREKMCRARRPRTSAMLLRCGSRLYRFPDADFTSLRHQEEREHEAHRGNRNRVDQRIADAAGGRKSCRSDERHQSATPAVADVIRHRHRRVPNSAGEE